MDFDLTDAQHEIVNGVRALCQRFPDEYWRGQDSRHEFPHDFYKAVADAGFLGIAIPDEYVGSGLGISEAALVMRELAYAGAMNAASAVHLGIFGLTPVIRYGTEELKRRILPRAVSGELHFSFAVTEPDAGKATIADQDKCPLKPASNDTYRKDSPINTGFMFSVFSFIRFFRRCQDRHKR